MFCPTRFYSPRVCARGSLWVCSPLARGGVHTPILQQWCLILCPAWGRVVAHRLATRLLGVAAVTLQTAPCDSVTVFPLASPVPSYVIYVISYFLSLIFVFNH